MAKVLSSSRGTSPRCKANALPSALVHYLGRPHTCAEVATVSFAWGWQRQRIVTLTANPLIGLEVSHTSLSFHGCRSAFGECPNTRRALGRYLAPAIDIMLALPSQAAPRGLVRMEAATEGCAIRATCHARPRVPRFARVPVSMAGHIATWLAVRHHHQSIKERSHFRPADIRRQAQAAGNGAKWPFLGAKWQGRAKIGVNPSATSSYK